MIPRRLSDRRREAVDVALALKASAASNRPPSYGGYWGGTYLSGSGWGPPQRGPRNYAAEVGRVDWNGIVRLCLRWYSNAITQASFRVGRKVKKGVRKGEYETRDTHPLSRILSRPNPVLSYRETWTRVIASYLIDGNAYLVIVRDNGGQPRELWWVPNCQVEVVASDDPRNPVAHYRVNGGRSSAAYLDYDPSDVVHIRDLIDEQNPILGMGVMRAFLEYVASLMRGGQYTDRALRRGNTGIVLMPPESAGGGYSYSAGEREGAEMAAHKRRLDRGFASDDDSPVMTLTSFLHHEKIGFSPEEMTLDRILDRPESYVCAAMGLSPLLFDLPSSSESRTYSNKGEARAGAWEDSLVPMLGVIAEAVQDQVLYRWNEDEMEYVGQFGDPPGLEVWADTSEVPALQENLAEKSETLIGWVDAGLATRQYAASQLDIPEEAVPEDEPEGGGEGEDGGETEPEGSDEGQDPGAGMIPGEDPGEAMAPDDDPDDPPEPVRVPRRRRRPAATKAEAGGVAGPDEGAPPAAGPDPSPESED